MTSSGSPRRTRRSDTQQNELPSWRWSVNCPHVEMFAESRDANQSISKEIWVTWRAPRDTDCPIREPYQSTWHRLSNQRAVSEHVTCDTQWKHLSRGRNELLNKLNSLRVRCITILRYKTWTCGRDGELIKYRTVLAILSRYYSTISKHVTIRQSVKPVLSLLQQLEIDRDI